MATSGRIQHERRNQEDLRVFQREEPHDVDSCVSGDGLEGFADVYTGHVDRIYNYVFHRVGSREDAEDLTARTFHHALERYADFEDRGAPVSAWLFRIAHNLVANWHRDRGRHPTQTLEGLELDSRLGRVGDALAERTWTGERIRRLIDAQDSDRQALLVLKFSEGMSNAQIGSVLGRTEGAIKSLYHRTLLDLRDEIEHRGPRTAEETGQD